MGCRAVTGLEAYTLLEPTRRGAQTVLDALGLLAPLQSVYAGISGHGLPKKAFSFRSPAGRCPTCRGSGTETVSMDALADLVLPCPTCGGARYRPEVRAVEWNGLSIDRLLEQPAADLAERFSSGRLADGAQGLVSMGLGHLALGRSTRTLSGGELQRLGMVAHWGRASGPVLHPTSPAGAARSRHRRLVQQFKVLVARGDLVVATVHRRSLVAAADHVIALGPDGGAGGRLVSLDDDWALPQVSAARDTVPQPNALHRFSLRAQAKQLAHMHPAASS